MAVDFSDKRFRSDFEAEKKRILAAIKDCEAMDKELTTTCGELKQSMSRARGAASLVVRMTEQIISNRNHRLALIKELRALKRDVLERRKRGRAHVYIPAVTCDTVRRSMLGELRTRLATVKTLTDLRALLDTLDRDVPFPKDAEGPRGRQGTPGKVVLPEGWLDDPLESDAAAMPGAEEETSGG